MNNKTQHATFRRAVLQARAFLSCLFIIFLACAPFPGKAGLTGVLPATPGGTDYQAYYDDVADLTWLQNANYFGTGTYWSAASSWVAGMSVIGVSGWRLPLAPQPDSSCELETGGNYWGDNCTGSEMGNLFYNVLGGVAEQSIATTHNSNYDLFSNIQSSLYGSQYWTGTDTVDPLYAFNFAFNGGVQYWEYKTYGPNNVWPVRDGGSELILVCGDGIVQPGEPCDDAGESATCNADCTTAACGDGIVNATAGEACDDAGESATCDADCTAVACGDGVTNVTAGEACDDAGESATCDADCTAAVCGDGFVNVTAGEACDDAGESATCNADCTAAACGDGIVNATAGEACDDAGESATCDADCTAVACGDGIVNVTAGEACDDAGESATCNVDCTAAVCGDGIVNATAGEACDDAGESATCDADCTAVACGDGVTNVTAGEACDDAGESATCNVDCTAAVCGDGIVNVTAGEACDDAGESATCNADCTAATCGDGVTNVTAGEACDDGNNIDGDGCSAICSLEDNDGDGIPDYSDNCPANVNPLQEDLDVDGIGDVCDICPADPADLCQCGDGVVQAPEQCDDIGESAACNFGCTFASCGDTVLNVTAGESCDDGNTADGDGCSSTCAIEGTVNFTTSRVSTNATSQEDSGTDLHAEISWGGAYVVFESTADDLVAGDTNGVADVFRKNVATGEILRVSTATGGAQADGASAYPRISGDGRYVVFESDATNLDSATADTNGLRDIYLKDIDTDSTIRISIDGVNQGNGSSTWASVSDDGTRVAFASSASNLIGAGVDTNASGDIFVWTSGTITRASTTTFANLQSDAGSARPRISADGNHVVFSSDATNLVAEVDDNSARDIFVKNLVTDETVRANVDSDGNQATGGWSFRPHISGDGRYVVFYSAAGNLVTGDTGHDDVFLRDMALGVTDRVSTDVDGNQANGGSNVAQVSDDGRYVVFDSAASNLVPGDSNSAKDVFIKDMQTGVIFRASVDAGGAQGNGQSLEPAISNDGRYVVHESDATNLVTDDTNTVRDIFRFANPMLTIPVVDLDQDGSSGASSGDYQTRFVVGSSSSVLIADSDAAILDGDSTLLSSLTVRLTNPQGNDALATGTLYGGIQLDPASTSTELLLTGQASILNYLETLKQIFFSTDASAPAGTRQVTVAARDEGGTYGAPATASIDVVGGLSIAVEETAYLVLAGADLSYTANVTNYDQSDATGVTLTVILPGDAVFNSFSGAELPDWDCNYFSQSNTAICSYIPLLAGGAMAQISIDLGLPAGSVPILAQFTVGGNQADAYTGDNSLSRQSLVVNYDDKGFAVDGILLESVATNYDHAGASVSADGNFIAVGIPEYGASDSGAVHVWRRQNGVWGMSDFLEPVVPEAAGYFGAAVKIDGNTLAIGAPGSGKTFIFGWNGSAWEQQQTLAASDSAPGDEFGFAVDVQGGTLVVGAPNADYGGYPGGGRVYVFSRTASGYVQTSLVDDLRTYSRLGSSLALDGGTLVLGAPGEAGGIQEGYAYVYVLENGSWNLQQELINNILTIADLFGRTVDISGNHIVVGAQYNIDGGLDSGAVHVYERNGNDWDFQQRLLATDAVGFEEFGTSVAIQDETIAVGAPYARTAEAQAAQAGSTYLFQLDNGVWDQKQKRSYPVLTQSPAEIEFGIAVALDGDTLAIGAPAVSGGMAFGDNTEHGLVLVASVDTGISSKLVPLVTEGRFGEDIAMSGDTILVGAPYEDQAGCNDCGAVYFYQRNGTAWDLQQHITGLDVGAVAFGSLGGAYFGSSVSIDNDTAVVGAYHDSADATSSGAVFVLVRSSNTWTLAQRLSSADAEIAYDNFGFAVDIDDSIIAVGAYADEDISDNPDSGSVYLFEFDGSSWNQVQKLYGGYGDPGEQFGWSLSVDGDILVVGAPNYDAGNGCAYSFVNSTGWTFDEILIPKQTITGAEHYGSAVALRGDDLLIGAPDAESVTVPLGVTTGEVFKYHRLANSWTVPISDTKLRDSWGASKQDGELFGLDVAFWEGSLVGVPAYDLNGLNDSGAVTFTEVLVADDAQSGDRYGDSVAVNGSAVAIGAPFEDGNQGLSDTGAVYVYTRFTSATVPGGIYGSAQSVYLTCGNCGYFPVQIWYTLDGSEPTPGGGNSMQYTGPITIDVTKTLKYATFDANGVLRETIKTEDFVIDTTSPDLPVISYPDPAIVDNIDSFPPASNISGTASDTGGSGLFLVQVAIQDADSGQYIELGNGGVFVGMNAARKWNTASGTTSWSLDMATNPFVEAGTYNLFVRAFDAVGNVSPVASSQFTYYTGEPAYMTLGLTLTSNSILNVTGDDPAGKGELDAILKLTEPGNLGADLSNREITLQITDPNDNVTDLQVLTVDAGGHVTVQDLGDGTLIDFATEGTWTLQAFYDGELTRQAAQSAKQTLLVGESAGSAVIIVGRAGGGDEGLTSHTKTALRIYDTLIKRGFLKDDILFLSPDTNLDGVADEGAPTGEDGADCEDADGCNNEVTHPTAPGAPNGIDGVPTLVASPTITGHINVQDAIEGLAPISSNNPGPRYVFLVDHGFTNQFLLTDTDTITPADLNSWLNNMEDSAVLNNGAETKPTVAVLGMCYSGSFMNMLAVSNNPLVRRVVISSATDGEESFRGLKENDGVRVGEFFIEEFIKEGGRGASLTAAFRYATELTELFTRQSDIAGPDPVFNDVAAQHPLLEDNGAFDPQDPALNNALADTVGADGEYSDDLYLGVGANVVTNASEFKSDIVGVTDTLFLPAGVSVAPITLDAVNNGGQVNTAMIEVRSPGISYTPSGGSSIQVEPVLTKKALNPPVSGPPPPDPPYNSWYRYYDQFSANAVSGKNEVYYLVEDISGVVSPVHRSVVYVNTTGNANPSPPVLVSPGDGATIPTAEFFDWEPSTDPEGDPITYTLEISLDPTFDTVDFKAEEIPHSYYFVDASAGLLDKKTYYWRVMAVDAFGGHDFSPVWQFDTDNTNIVAGGVFVTVSGNALNPVELGNDGVVTAYVPCTPQPSCTPTTVVNPVDPPAGEDPYPHYQQETKTYFAKYPIDSTGYDFTVTGMEAYGFDTGVTEEPTPISQSTLPTANVVLPVNDRDGDGLSDVVETNTGTYVDATNTGTDPDLRDTDGDGLDDGPEVNTHHTDPNKRDSDGDGFGDGVEISAGTDPTVDDGAYPPADGDLAPLNVYDGIVNAADYLVAQRMALGLETQTPLAKAHGDVVTTGTSSGVIDTADVLWILQQALNGP